MGSENISSKVKKLEDKKYRLESVTKQFLDKAKDESSETSKLYKNEYKKVEKLQAEIEKAQEKVEGPKRKATDKKDKDIEKINEKLEKIAKQLDDLEMKREEIIQQLSSLKQEEKDIMDKISSFGESDDPKEMMDLRKRLDSVRRQISTLDGRLRRVEAKIAMMNKRKTRANEVAIARTGKVLEKYNKEMVKWGANPISVSDMVNARRDFIEQEDKDRRRNAQEAYKNRGNNSQEENNNIDEYIEDLNNNYGPASQGANKDPKADKGQKGKDENNDPKADKGQKGKDGNKDPKADKGQKGKDGNKDPKADKGQKGKDENKDPKADKGQKGKDGSKDSGDKKGQKGKDGNNDPKADKGQNGQDGNKGPEPVNAQNPQVDNKNQSNNGQELDDAKREEIIKESENRLLAKEEKSIPAKILHGATKVAGTVVGTVAGVFIVAGRFIYNSVGKLIGTVGNKEKEDVTVESDEPKVVKVRPQKVEDKSSFAQRRAEMQTRIDAQVSTQKAINAVNAKAKDKYVQRDSDRAKG